MPRAAQSAGPATPAEPPADSRLLHLGPVASRASSPPRASCCRAPGQPRVARTSCLPPFEVLRPSAVPSQCRVARDHSLPGPGMRRAMPPGGSSPPVPPRATSVRLTSSQQIAEAPKPRAPGLASLTPETATQEVGAYAPHGELTTTRACSHHHHGRRCPVLPSEATRRSCASGTRAFCVSRWPPLCPLTPRDQGMGSKPGPRRRPVTFPPSPKPSAPPHPPMPGTASVTELL